MRIMLVFLFSFVAVSVAKRLGNSQTALSVMPWLPSATDPCPYGFKTVKTACSNATQVSAQGLTYCAQSCMTTVVNGGFPSYFSMTYGHCCVPQSCKLIQPPSTFLSSSATLTEHCPTALRPCPSYSTPAACAGGGSLSSCIQSCNNLRGGSQFFSLNYGACCQMQVLP